MNGTIMIKVAKEKVEEMKPDLGVTGEYKVEKSEMIMRENETHEKEDVDGKSSIRGRKVLYIAGLFLNVLEECI